ncbi:MAG: DUF6544 family protein [Bacillota bacterium]|jgi:hypothetical protein
MSKVFLIIIGIILIIVLLFFLVSTAGEAIFNQKVKKEVADILNDTENKNEIIRKEDLAGLPLPVQKWLETSGVVGKEKIKTVHLKQKGFIRTKEDMSWMPVEADQYYTVDKPRFIWHAKVKMAPLLYFVGRDKYDEGRGNMLIKLLSLITVANGTGPEIDQGTLLRYLGEIVWFPTAALASYITWEEIDAHSAQATMTYGGITASAIFKFNDQGEVTDYLCDRYMTVDDGYRLEKYSVPMEDYQELDGLQIPTRAVGMWKLHTGDFSYYKAEVTEIEYNKPLVY